MSPAEASLDSDGCVRPPRVSVILNLFNGEPYLRDAIDAVLAQSYRDWELVIWDDLSTDASAVLVASYGDPRIRYSCAPQHSSLGQARYLAIEQARGEWLAFLDQDDVWTPDKLARQIALIDEDATDELGLVYTRTRMFGRRGPGRDFDHRHEFTPLPEGQILDELFASGCFIAISSCMLRTSAYRLAGGMLREFSFAGDYYLFVAVAAQFRARAVQELCCWYRKHDASMSQSPQVRIRVHQDALRIVDRWASQIGDDLAGRRRRVHQTLIGVEEALGERRVLSGLRRILRHGSMRYLLSRPFARSLRVIRRALYRRPIGTVPACVRAREDSRGGPCELGTAPVVRS